MNDIIEMLDDLHKQATFERSHFYVGKCARDAITEIKGLRDAIKKANDSCGEWADENERLTADC